MIICDRCHKRMTVGHEVGLAEFNTAGQPMGCVPKTSTVDLCNHCLAALAQAVRAFVEGPKK